MDLRPSGSRPDVSAALLARIGRAAAVCRRVGGDTASLRRDSLVRLAADGFALAAAMVTAIVTARALGPSGKGYYASLTLLATLCVAVFDAGIGDALIVLTVGGRAKLSAAATSTAYAVLILMTGASCAFLVAGVALFDPHGSSDRLALGLGGVFVAVSVGYTTLVSVLLALQRMVAVSGFSALAAGATAAVALVVLAGLGSHVEGAMLASVCGVATGLGATLLRVRSERVRLRPQRVPGYLREAFRLGLSFQVSNLLVVAAARLDLLLVFKLSGAAAAGRYSIALTIGAIVALVPAALSYAAFPRVPRLGQAEARVLISRLLVIGLVAALIVAAALAAATPLLLPKIFGPGFAGAVGPTLVLLVAGVLWSGQWLLSRAWAARGDTRPLFVSFAASFLVMVTLDLALIPKDGPQGAALASLASSAVGAAVAAAFHVRAGARTRS